MVRLSFICIGHNEKQHITQLLPNLLQFGDEVVYVDCDSQDDSLKLAEELGCGVFPRPNHENLNVNKSYAIDQTTGEWVFYVDPDERLPEELLQEIRSLVDSHPLENGFQLARRNYFFGKWLKSGGQYPDIQLRLFRKGFGYFPQLHVHEKIQISGKIGRLENDMIHHPYTNISQYLAKFDFYSRFEANFLHRKKVRISWSNHAYYLFYKPISRFFRRFVIKGGFRDGLPGFFAAAFDAAGWIVRYLKLWEIKNGSNLLELDDSKPD